MKLPNDFLFQACVVLLGFIAIVLLHSVWKSLRARGQSEQTSQKLKTEKAPQVSPRPAQPVPVAKDDSSFPFKPESSPENFTHQKPQPQKKRDFLAASRLARYEPKALLNRSEKTIYWELIKRLKSQYCVCPQVSMGEYIGCENKEGFDAINSKRNDFLITDKQFNPVAVIEFNGKGHYQGNYAMRDQIKENAVTRAGLKFIELTSPSPIDIEQALLRSGLIMRTESA